MSDHEHVTQRGHPAEPLGGAGKPEGRPPKAVPAEPSGSSPPRPKRRSRQLVKESNPKQLRYSGEQRLLILDVWRRSSLPAADFAPLVGVSMHSLYKWKKLFETEGPAGLLESPRRKVRESMLPEVTRRSIVMLKESNPDYVKQAVMWNRPGGIACTRLKRGGSRQHR